MGKEEKYPNMYFMNNGGTGKFRQLKPGEYFSIIQPNHKAVGDGAVSYSHAILFKGKDRKDLTSQIDRFVKSNETYIDFEESSQLVELVSKDCRNSISNGRKYEKNAEISCLVNGYQLPIAKTLKNSFIGPEGSTKWMLYCENPGDVLYGKNKDANPLTYIWWK